jgi:hypothetical protein
VPVPLIIVFTELVLPLLALVVPNITVVVVPVALVMVTVDPVPPVKARASKVIPNPVILRLALLAILMAFVPAVVASVPTKVLLVVVVHV